MIFETYGLTALALFVMSAIAAPWSISDAVNMFRSGRRGQGALSAILALFCSALAVYLIFWLPSLLSFPKTIPELPFLWDLVLNNL